MPPGHTDHCTGGPGGWHRAVAAVDDAAAIPGRRGDVGHSPGGQPRKRRMLPAGLPKGPWCWGSITETNRITWSYLGCRIGHLVPIWQPMTGTSFRLRSLLQWMPLVAATPHSLPTSSRGLCTPHTSDCTHSSVCRRGNHGREQKLAKAIGSWVGLCRTSRQWIRKSGWVLMLRCEPSQADRQTRAAL
jgi:hypothetical protein